MQLNLWPQDLNQPCTWELTSATYSPLQYDEELGTVRQNKVYKSQVTLIWTLVLLLPMCPWALGFSCLRLSLIVCGANWIITALANGECVVYVWFFQQYNGISVRSNHLPASLWAQEMAWQTKGPLVTMCSRLHSAARPALLVLSGDPGLLPSVPLQAYLLSCLVATMISLTSKVSWTRLSGIPSRHLKPFSLW